jgi:hypothetical protein
VESEKMIKMQQNIHYLNSYIRKNSIGMANGQRKESNLKLRVTILPKIDSSIILYFLGINIGISLARDWFAQLSEHIECPHIHI